MRTWAHSGQLQFTRDGKTLVVAERDGVTFVEPRGDGRRRTPIAGAAQISGGCVIFDGTSRALVVEHPRGRDLVVVALASGRVFQPVALPPGTVRIAARRGLAVVAARRLALVDLRFGRLLGAVVSDDDVTDVAIDPDGKLLAIRLAGAVHRPMAPTRVATPRRPCRSRPPSSRSCSTSSRARTRGRPQGNRPRSPDREDRT